MTAKRGRRKTGPDATKPERSLFSRTKYSGPKCPADLLSLRRLVSLTAPTSADMKYAERCRKDRLKAAATPAGDAASAFLRVFTRGPHEREVWGAYRDLCKCPANHWPFIEATAIREGLSVWEMIDKAVLPQLQRYVSKRPHLTNYLEAVAAGDVKGHQSDIDSPAAMMKRLPRGRVTVGEIARAWNLSERQAANLDQRLRRARTSGKLFRGDKNDYTRNLDNKTRRETGPFRFRCSAHGMKQLLLKFLASPGYSKARTAVGKP